VKSIDSFARNTAQRHFAFVSGRYPLGGARKFCNNVKLADSRTGVLHCGQYQTSPKGKGPGMKLADHSVTHVGSYLMSASSIRRTFSPVNVADGMRG